MATTSRNSRRACSIPALDEAGVGKKLENYDPRYYATYYAIDAINCEPVQSPAVMDTIDGPYLPLVIQEAAGIPLDPSFEEQKSIMLRCKGTLFYACKDGAEARPLQPALDRRRFRKKPLAARGRAKYQPPSNLEQPDRRRQHRVAFRFYAGVGLVRHVASCGRWLSCSPRNTDLLTITLSLLAWVFANCLFLLVLPRPGVSAALALSLVALLIALSRFKFEILQLTLTFLDFLIIDRDTFSFCSRCFRDCGRS